MLQCRPTPIPVTHEAHANAVRVLAMDGVEKAASGHPGMPLGMADVATVLWTRFLRFSPHQPDWPNRDRFVLSAGHGSMLLYALLYLTGYPDMTLGQLKAFRQLGSLTPGHPEYPHTPGVEITTGPLGQGLAHGVGLALGESILSARLDAPEILQHYTYVVVGDGCLMEGLSQEAISLAGHLRLSRLIVLFDDNGITIDGPTSLSTSEDTLARFTACSWHVQSIDGHDPEAIERAIEAAKTSPLPSLIACKTHIAYGAPTKQDTASAHGAPLGAEEIAATRKALGWPHTTPFDIPDSILRSWREVGKQGDEAFNAWQRRYEALNPDLKRSLDFEDGFLVQEPCVWHKALRTQLQRWLDEKPALATRQASQQVLNIISPALQQLIGGSADLTPSNNTLAKGMQVITAQNKAGNYVHYGIREHAMAAAVNGLTRYGFRAYGGTFLTFSDYARPAIRLAALMELPSIFVMTHDSIGLGEDGPTHQPIEHLMSLRAMPNLNVFRPADAVEVAQCWELALMALNTPSILALSRQALPALRPHQGYHCEKGAYILKEATLPHKVTLFATGSEVHLACEVATLLETQAKVGARVVSVPCWRLFDLQPQSYRDAIMSMPAEGLNVAIEAGSSMGWERYVGRDGLIFGIDTFGASAPGKEVFAHMGLTPEHILKGILKRLPEKEG